MISDGTTSAALRWPSILSESKPMDERHDLYLQYYERVVGYLVRKHQFPVDEARDLAQDVFIRVFRHMEKSPIAAAWLFLKATAHNVAVNEIRSRSIHRRTLIGSADALPKLAETVRHAFWTDEDPPSPETEAQQQEEATLLRDAIEALPATLRVCLLLRLDGLSYEEIAVALHITVDAVRTRLRDAKKLLLSRMRPGGG